MNSDFKDLLALFNQYNVRYLVAGGYAVMYYTEPRYTKDLDVVIGLSEHDITNAGRALAEFGFPLNSRELAELYKPNKMIILGRPPVRIDILNHMDGVDFDEAWARRTEVQVGDVTCCFLSLVDLISAKKAAGRPQDHLDLVGLERELAVRSSLS